MLYRSLAAALLALAGAGSASAQSVYVAPGGVYVAPGGSVYVTPQGGGAYYGAPAAVAPTNGYVAPGEYYAPPVSYVAPGADYGVPTAPLYDPPLQAYGSVGGVAVQRRVYIQEPPRPPAPVPYGRWRGW
ncbi:MAG: hypothetical protein ACJ8F3_08225 [Xanthobacteraceae bacterium]